MLNKNSKLKVGILGATGTVGQKFIVLLQNHPWFEISALAASKDSAGQTYEKAVAGRWKQEVDIPESIRKMIVQDASKPNLKSDFVFSGLDASVAGEIEKAFAKEGYPVISNTKNYRMDADVPLMVPEVNPDHAQVIPLQKERRKWRGFIVTNPNCVAVPLAMALKPIHEKYGVGKVIVTSMQAISGAGYPGVPSLDILDNIIPMIGGEEPKVETEPLKLLGELTKKKTFKFANIKISAHCNRVPTKDGHFITVSFSTRKPAKVGEIKRLIRNFKAEPQKLKLPSAPLKPLVYHDDEFRPQTRLDRDREGGMAVSVGRLREDRVLGTNPATMPRQRRGSAKAGPWEGGATNGFKMVVLGHNTIRGAAGVAILNAELLCKKGYLTNR